MIHINTDWRGRAKPGPWYGRYYEDWDAAHPKAWVRGQAVPGRFYVAVQDALAEAELTELFEVFSSITRRGRA